MSRPWTLWQLACVAVLSGAGAALCDIAETVARPAREIDIALWALIGREPGQALIRLNGHGVLT